MYCRPVQGGPPKGTHAKVLSTPNLWPRGSSEQHRKAVAHYKPIQSALTMTAKPSPIRGQVLRYRAHAIALDLALLPRRSPLTISLFLFRPTIASLEQAKAYGEHRRVVWVSRLQHAARRRPLQAFIHATMDPLKLNPRPRWNRHQAAARSATHATRRGASRSHIAKPPELLRKGLSHSWISTWRSSRSLAFTRRFCVLFRIASLTRGRCAASCSDRETSSHGAAAHEHADSRSVCASCTSLRSAVRGPPVHGTRFSCRWTFDQEYTAGSPDRHIPVAAHLVNEFALADRLQAFGGARPEASPCPGSDRDHLRSFEFSSSAASVAHLGRQQPSYFFFQLNSRLADPALRQISATNMPSAPCFRMNAFWRPKTSKLSSLSLLPAWESPRKTLPKTIQFCGLRADMEFAN